MTSDTNNNQTDISIPQGYVLLVDDEPALLRSAKLSLRSSGIESVETLSDSREVLPLLAKRPASLIMLDLNMPYITGEGLLAQLAEIHPDIPVIVMTAENNISTAVNCMRSGACDYLVKPVDIQRLVTSVQQGLEIASLRKEVDTMRQSLLTGELQQPAAFSNILTCSDSIFGIFQYMEAIAPTRAPVLITGETGTGKELFATAIHTLSNRTGPFIPVTVAGLDDNIFSDTLFGHKKGAYTGADHARDGLLAAAQNGTIFLDEIGDLSTASQIKLLRLLQEGEYYTLGEDTPRSSNARVVVATNVDLNTAMNNGNFRQDLYFRLRGHNIHIPPLRERREDLSFLAAHFISAAADEMKKSCPTVPKDLSALFSAYQFPGNVRELQTLLFDAVARHQSGMLSLASIRTSMGLGTEETKTSQACNGVDFKIPSNDELPSLKDAEEYLIEEALKRAEGNQGVAAKLLGISRQALNKRLSRTRTDKNNG